MNDFHIKLSFRKKLLLSFIVLSFIPVLLIGITTYRLYNRFITDMTEKSSVETIDLICNDIDSLLNDTWQLCDALTRDIKIQENLRVKFVFHTQIFPLFLFYHTPTFAPNTLKTDKKKRESLS